MVYPHSASLKYMQKWISKYTFKMQLKGPSKLYPNCILEIQFWATFLEYVLQMHH